MGEHFEFRCQISAPMYTVDRTYQELAGFARRRAGTATGSGLRRPARRG
ncbi:hypothetical protein ACVTE8_15345 [Staphylococcus aureus]